MPAQPSIRTALSGLILVLAAGLGTAPALARVHAQHAGAVSAPASAPVSQASGQASGQASSQAAPQASRAATPEGELVLIDGVMTIVLHGADADVLTGDTMPALLERTVAALNFAIAETQEGRNT